MVDNLTVDDVKSIAGSRANKSKKIGWNRRYTFPTYILFIIGVVAMMAQYSLYPDEIFVSDAGRQIAVVQDNKGKVLEINGEIYRKDYNLSVDTLKSNLTRVFLVSFAIAIAIWLYWYYKVKKPYVNKFIEYWENNHTLME